MNIFIWIIIGLLVIFGTLFFLYKKGQQVRDKELKEGFESLKNANKKQRKKFRYSGNGYRDFKKKPVKN